MTISQSEIDALLSSAGGFAEVNEADSPPPPPAPAAPAAPVASPGGTPAGHGPFFRPLVDYPPELARIMRMRVPVLVTLAARDVSLSSVLNWTLGSIIEFDIPADSELQLVIGNKPIGRGHAVKVGENFGLRVTTIGDLAQRITAMGR